MVWVYAQRLSFCTPRMDCIIRILDEPGVNGICAIINAGYWYDPASVGHENMIRLLQTGIGEFRIFPASTFLLIE